MKNIRIILLIFVLAGFFITCSEKKDSAQECRANGQTCGEGVGKCCDRLVCGNSEAEKKTGICLAIR